MSFQQQKTQFNLQNKCTNCGAPQSKITLDYKQGTIVCTGCGLNLVERLIDYTAEWNKFQDNSNATGVDPSRVSGCPMNLEEDDNGLGIEIMSSGKLGKQFKSILQYQTPEQQRSAKIISSIKKRGKCLSQSSQVIQDSINAFQKIFQKPEKIKGKNNFYIVIGILVIQMRVSGVNVLSIDSIAQITDKNIEKISQAIKFIYELRTSEQEIVVSNTNLVNEMAQKLKLAISVNTQSQKIADKIIELGHLEGKNPKTIALVAIYITCQLTGQSKSLSEISFITGVSKVTIQNSYKIIYEHLDEIIHSWEGRLPLIFLPPQAN